MWNFSSEIPKSNIMENVDQNLFFDPNNNYKIITHVLRKANSKHMPYKLVKFKKQTFSIENKWYTDTTYITDLNV